VCDYCGINIGRANLIETIRKEVFLDASKIVCSALSVFLNPSLHLLPRPAEISTRGVFVDFDFVRHRFSFR